MAACTVADFSCCSGQFKVWKPWTFLALNLSHVNTQWNLQGSTCEGLVEYLFNFLSSELSLIHDKIRGGRISSSFWFKQQHYIFPTSVSKEQCFKYIMALLKRISVFLSLLAAQESSECTISQCDVMYTRFKKNELFCGCQTVTELHWTRCLTYLLKAPQNFNRSFSWHFAQHTSHNKSKK